MSKHTPFYNSHIKYKGKMVEYAGYSLPVFYDGLGLMTEHNATRNSCGLFDVSHMGEFLIEGEGALEFCDYILSGDIKGLVDGGIRYTLLANEKGGAVDDVLIYRFNEHKFMLVVNAAAKEKDEIFIKKHLPTGLKFANISDGIAQIAVQGPFAKEIMAKVCNVDDLPEKFFSFKDGIELKLPAAVKCLVSRTGYTGEFGYEIYFEDLGRADELFDAIAAAGATPCGLGARDSLRFEAGMPLYGHELNEDYLLTETDLSFTVKLNKGEFLGRDVLTQEGAKYNRIGVKVKGGIAREGAKVFCGEEEVGAVTSGTHSPTLGMPLAMLRVKKEFIDKELKAEVRGRLLELEKVPLPFYKAAAK